MPKWWYLVVSDICNVLILKDNVNLKYFDIINIYFGGAEIFPPVGRLQVLPIRKVTSRSLIHNLGFLLQICVAGTRRGMVQLSSA